MHKNSLLSHSNYKLFSYLFLLWSISVAQPIMRVLGDQPVFFVAHEIRGLALILFTLVLNVIPPIMFFVGINILAVFSKSIKEWSTRFVIFLLLILFILTLTTSLSAVTAMLISAIMAVSLTVALIKIEIVKTYALVLAPVSLIFIVMFLLFSPSHQLIQAPSQETSRVKTNNDNPVFVFVFDEFPLLSLLKNNHQIDESRFPTFAQFAKEATWYSNAHAISNSTEIALPAIISGSKPSTKEAHLGTYQQYPNNLFTYFSNSHSIHAIENTTRMCPPYLCKSLLKDPYQILAEDVFVSYLYQLFPLEQHKLLPPINDRWMGYLREIKNEKMKKFDFSERLNKFDEFVHSFSKYPKNTLHFLHILLPHAPWRVLPDLKIYGFYEHDGIPGELKKGSPLAQINLPYEWTKDDWATQMAWRRHLLQVGGVDKLLNKALDEIKKLSLYDAATIVVVADHGAAFKAGLSRRYVHGNNSPDIVSVPMFIKFPNQTTGQIDSQLASNLDILPTLLATYGIQAQSFDGINLKGDIKRKQAEEMIQEDKTVWTQPSDFAQMFEKTLHLKNQLFPNGGWHGVFHPSDSEKFYHHDITALQIKKTLKKSIKLMNNNLFDKVDSNSRYVPVYYRLHYLLEDKSAHEILVAVNNKIISHCYMFVHEPYECAGLIDPKDYETVGGKALNLRFFSVLDVKNNTYVVNELLQQSQTKASLISQNKQLVIQLNNGNKLPIDSQAIPAGEATIRLIEDASSYQIDGWAGDTQNGQVAQKIYLFINDQLYTTTETGVEKNYVYLRYGYKSLLNSGFQINVPITQLPQIEKNKFKVFAQTAQGGLVELNYHADVKNPEFLNNFKPFTNRKIPIDNLAVLALKVQYLKDEKLLNAMHLDAFDTDFDKISTGQWYAINKHSRWLGTSVGLAIPNKHKLKAIKLKITAKPFLVQDSIQSQDMAIKINGRQVKKWTFTHKQTQEVDIDVSSFDVSKPLIVELLLPDAIAPSSISDSLDSRLLSLHVTDFTMQLLQK